MDRQRQRHQGVLVVFSQVWERLSLERQAQGLRLQEAFSAQAALAYSRHQLVLVGEASSDWEERRHSRRPGVFSDQVVRLEGVASSDHLQEPVNQLQTACSGHKLCQLAD